MGKSEITKSLLLLLFIGVIIAMVQPITALEQDSSTDDCEESSNASVTGKDLSDDEECEESYNENYPSQEDIDCADYNMEEAIKIHEMHLINESTMTEESNMKMMDRMVKAYSCLTGENLTSEMVMESKLDSKNVTMMQARIMEEDFSNESRYMAKMGYDSSSDQGSLDCTIFWLKKAIELHEMHMKMPNTSTEESNMVLFFEMLRAHTCLTSKNMMSMEMNKMTDNGSECADYNMEMALMIHAIHLVNPDTANEKSQMEMMDHMMYAYECLTGENMTMAMMDSEEHSENETMMHDCMMQCIMHHMNEGQDHSADEKTITEDNSSNMNDMKCPCMMEDHSSNDSLSMVKMDQNNLSEIGQDCAIFWLKEAIELHEMHMKEPSTATDESQMELMHLMLKADVCLTGEKITENMDITENKTTAYELKAH